MTPGSFVQHRDKEMISGQFVASQALDLHFKHSLQPQDIAKWKCAKEIRYTQSSRIAAQLRNTHAMQVSLSSPI